MEQAIAAPAGGFKEGAGKRADSQALPASADSQPTKNNVQYAGREWTSEHPLNIRMSVPLIFGRYYITIVAGKERRARARLALDKRQHPLDTPGNVVFLFLVGLIAAAGSMTVGYMLLAHVLGWSGRLVF